MTVAPVALALDLGGTQVRAALVDSTGTVLRRRSVATAASAGLEAVLQQLYDVAADVADGISKEVIRGVGVASSGPLDADAGIVVEIPTIAGFVDVPLCSILKAHFALPVALENDAVAAALAEWRFGAGRGHDNLVYVTVSTGIGGGVIADGRVVRGRRGLAGHVGHMTIERDGMPCVCGNRGCWEAYGSGPAFLQRARRRAVAAGGGVLSEAPTALTAAAVFAAAASGDQLARELVAEEADILGVGIAALLHLFSPEIVIIGGGMASDFAMLHPGIRARLQQAAMPAFREVSVVAAALGGNAGLVGAAALVFAGVQAAAGGPASA